MDLSDIESLPLEIQYKFLLRLAPKDIIAYCRTSKKQLHICQDDYFWYLKIEYDGLVGEIPEGMPGLLAYKYLFAVCRSREIVSEVDKVSATGYKDVLERLAVKDILPNAWGANLAAKNGHLEVLHWLATKGILPNVLGANRAAENGHLEILEWMVTKDILPDVVGANRAAENGHLEILEWMVTKDILPDFWI